MLAVSAATRLSRRDRYRFRPARRWRSYEPDRRNAANASWSSTGGAAAGGSRRAGVHAGGGTTQPIRGGGGGVFLPDTGTATGGGPRGWRDAPADTECGREDLAHRAEQRHVRWPGALHGSDRTAVVPVFRVVVVLADQPPGTAGPVEQGAAELRGEHDSGRKLMRGCDDDGPHVSREV